MPEEHTKICALIIGWNHKAAIHIGMPTRFMAEELAHAIYSKIMGGVFAPLQDGIAEYLGNAAGDDTERFTASVKVLSGDFHATLPHRRKVERATGIEPALKAWEALVMPFHYARVCGSLALHR